MPLTKVGKKREPLWKEWDRLAQKEGPRKTFYAVGGDEYTGDWHDNKKHGKGVQIWKRSGLRYEGDWANGNRHGYGMLSQIVRDKDGEDLVKQYAGGWKNDLRHGYGTQFYSLPGEYYEGEWYANQRSGWGRMYFSNGSVYEGEWFEDKRNGKGLLKLANGNRYEGLWKDDMKHGDGKYLYLDKGQIYTGVWCNDIAKCGSMVDYHYETNRVPNKPDFPIPECKLKDIRTVLQEAAADLEH